METTQQVELRDESIYPDEKVLEGILGDSFSAYRELLKLFDKNGLQYGWRFYKDVKAWLCKVQKKDKTIVWMSAWKGYIKATIYLPEKYAGQIYTLDISEELKEKFRLAGNMKKSTPCTFEVRNENMLVDISKVMQLKMATK
jgi:hypothetical protein